MPGKLFLIDGHALVFKMYYAFLRRPMINSKGEDMSILNPLRPTKINVFDFFVMYLGKR